jgi:hypothetical protein
MQNLKHYFETTHNLFVYKLGSNIRTPSTLQFPNAKTATLINCTREGVFQILTPHIFPSLQTIQYISAHPGQFDIHKRFPAKVQWILPDKSYEFYEILVHLKKGHKDPHLIDRCLLNKRILDGVSPFDISYEFDLHLPKFGILGGDVYKKEFDAYCEEKLKELKDELY